MLDGHQPWEWSPDLDVSRSLCYTDHMFEMWYLINAYMHIYIYYIHLNIYVGGIFPWRLHPSTSESDIPVMCHFSDVTRFISAAVQLLVLIRLWPPRWWRFAKVWCQLLLQHWHQTHRLLPKCMRPAKRSPFQVKGKTLVVSLYFDFRVYIYYIDTSITY